MDEFYVLPAHVIQDLEPIDAAGERQAAKKAAERDGILSGQVAVIPASSVVFKTLDSDTTIEAADVP